MSIEIQTPIFEGNETTGLKVYFSHWSKMRSRRPTLVGWWFDFNSSYPYITIWTICDRMILFHHFRLQTELHSQVSTPNLLCIFKYFKKRNEQVVLYSLQLKYKIWIFFKLLKLKKPPRQPFECIFRRLVWLPFINRTWKLTLSWC